MFGRKNEISNRYLLDVCDVRIEMTKSMDRRPVFKEETKRTRNQGIVLLQTIFDFGILLLPDRSNEDKIILKNSCKNR